MENVEAALAGTARRERATKRNSRNNPRSDVGENEQKYMPDI
jgi:hypothetical protein